jgi:hypothetical protein
MITITTVPGVLLVEDHLSYKYLQGPGIYVWGVSSRFRSAVWYVPGSGRGVRAGIWVDVGATVVVDVSVGMTPELLAVPIVGVPIENSLGEGRANEQADNRTITRDRA